MFRKSSNEQDTEELLEIAMGTNVRLLQLALLVLAVDIATRDVTASKANSTEKETVVYKNRSENSMNATVYHLPLQQNPANMGFTAGRTVCRIDSSCGYHQGSTYSYCYVDYSDNWDYCCTGECNSHGYTYIWCQSGNQWQYCGDAGFRGVDGISCYYSHQCGTHQETGKKGYYWCYIDHKLNWRQCCAPSSKCDYYGYDYKWCYTGIFINTYSLECDI